MKHDSHTKLKVMCTLRMTLLSRRTSGANRTKSSKRVVLIKLAKGSDRVERKVLTLDQIKASKVRLCFLSFAIPVKVCRLPQPTTMALIINLQAILRDRMRHKEIRQVMRLMKNQTRLYSKKVEQMNRFRRNIRQ